MQVRVYATLRDVTGTNKIQLHPAKSTNIGDVLHRLVADYPALGAKMWDSEGNPTGYMTVLLNGRSIEYLAGLETPVSDDDIISLFPPVGGG